MGVLSLCEARRSVGSVNVASLALRTRLEGLIGIPKNSRSSTQSFREKLRAFGFRTVSVVKLLHNQTWLHLVIGWMKFWPNLHVFSCTDRRHQRSCSGVAGMF